DEIEGRREELAADEDGDLGEIARLDAEIAGLYAQLEQFAGDASDEEGEDEDDLDDDEQPAAAAPAPVAAAAAPAPAPAPEPDFEESPFGGPAPAPVAAADFGGGNAFASSDYTDVPDDYKPKGGAMKWVVLLVLVGGGVGGFMWWKQQESAKAAAAAAAQQDTRPAPVFPAGSVPDDAEDRKAARGQDVNRRPEAEIEKSRRNGGGDGGNGGSRNSAPV